MSNPQIKVGADLGGVNQGIDQLGKKAADANKAAEKTLAAARKQLQGYVGDIEKAKRAFEDLQKSGARGTRNIRGKSFEEYTGGGWQGASVNDAEAARMHRDIMRRVGLTPKGGAAGSALGFGGHAMFTAGRGIMQSAFPVGGVGANIAQSGYQAARQSSGGLWSGGGLARLGMGAGIGMAAFGAIKGIRSIAGKVGQAEDESSNYADMVRQVGAVSSAFGDLRDSIRQATAGMGLTYNESAKLAAAYAHEAGTGPKTRGGLAAEVGGSVGFARGFGLDPETGARFFGAMRHNGVTAGEGDNRKLALQIGDAVAAKGEFSRAGELIDAVHQFVSVSARGLQVANVSGFLGMTSKLGGLGLPGLGLSESAGLASKLDAGFRNPGGGEAGDNFMLSMLQRLSPDAGGQDLAAVKAGGMYARGSDVFGQKSAQYLLAQKRGDKAEMARLDKISGALGSKTMGDHLFDSLDGMHMGTQAMIGSASTFFGTSAPESAAALSAHLASGGSNKLSARLGRLGLDTSKLTPANFGLLTALEGGGRDALEAQGKDLLGRKGAGALTSGEAAQMSRLLAGGDTEGLRDHVMKMSAVRGNASDGELARKAMADLSNTFQTFADKAIPLLTTLRDVAVKAAEYVPGSGFKRGALEEMKAAEARAAAGPNVPDLGEPGAGVDGGGSGMGGSVNLDQRPRGKFDGMIDKAAARYGVSAKWLKAIIAKESNFNPDAIGPRNRNGTQDFGMMQINSANFGALGLTADTALDPETNVDRGAKRAAQLLAQKHGDLRAASKAYNGSGPAADAYADAIMKSMGAGDATVPEAKGGPNHSQDGNHHKVTVTVQNPAGAPLAPPVTVGLGAPRPAGAVSGY